MSRMPIGPVRTPGAWLGPQAREREDQWSYRLSEAERDEVRAATVAAVERSLSPRDLTPRSFHLPTVGPRLRRFARDISEGLGFLLIREFPTDDFSDDEIRLMYFGAMTHVGIPIAQSARNDLIGDVRDEGRATETTRGYQTSRELNFHSDSADLVTLFCLRPAASGGASRILSAVTVHNLIQATRPDLLRILYDEPFYCSWSGQEPKGQPPYYWSRFYSWYQGRLHTSGIKERYVDSPPMSDGQKEAIAHIRQLIDERQDELSLEMQFQRGDVQILDDSVVWHSRTAFTDAHDPAMRRHLLRIWLSYHIERPVAPDFSNRHEMLGQLTESPKRRLFDVEVFDAW